jgi:guanine nucleotide-binding protein subunit beta-5
VTVYTLSLEEDVSTKKKTVGTHTSYMSCCIFPNSDQQVCVVQKHGVSVWIADKD